MRDRKWRKRERLWERVSRGREKREEGIVDKGVGECSWG